MKNLQSISLLKQFQIPSQIIHQINGGTKRAQVDSEEDVE